MSVIANTAKASTPPAVPPAEAELVEFEIKPQRGWVAVNFKELLHYRELLYFLVWRDVKVRYKQTMLGFGWAILQPMMNMIVQTLVFGVALDLAARMPAELREKHTPYSLFVYAALLPWMFFSTGVSTGGISLLNQQNLLTKIYFPRLFVPASVIGAALVDTAISFAVFFGIMACLRVIPPWTVIFVPGLLILTTLASTGIACLLSALTITYRDFRFLIPFMVQMWQLISGVGFPLYSEKHAWVNWVLRLNPMYGIINAYRSALLGQHWDLVGLGIATVEILGLLLYGLYYFKKMERRFADIA